MIEAFWSVPVEQALAETDSSTKGLGRRQAKARLLRDGPNAIDERKHLSALLLLVRQFASPLALILVFGAGISMLLRQWIDAAIILSIVGGSGLLSFTQEYRATRAVAALNARLALKARVVRDQCRHYLSGAAVERGNEMIAWNIRLFSCQRCQISAN